jgi:acyl-coenzyme A synthetase/AMP-(fatty) acid ligase
MTLPFTYSYGNSVLLTHAAAGASIVIDNSAAYPYKILENIKKYGVSGFSTVGSYISLMLKCIRSSDTDEGFFSSLRYITLAGEATGDSDISFIRSFYPALNIFIMYGQTEAGARLSYLSPELLPAKIGSVGKGLCNTELRVINESGADVRPGEIGEIIARGPSIMKCYWDDPDATDEVLRDGWLYTGDNASVDEDGFIYIKGRKTDMIKCMGHRISPAEIENVINGIDSVKECAVVESALGSLGVIKAFIVTEKEYSLDEIKKYVCSKLPSFMCPQVFEIVSTLPKTDTGKIRRSALRISPCAE